jgi:hypothetical protein
MTSRRILHLGSTQRPKTVFKLQHEPDGGEWLEGLGNDLKR